MLVYSIPLMIYRSIVHATYEQPMILSVESLMTISDIADWVVE